MSRIVRHEFLGSPLLVLFLCLTGILLPIAVIYFLESLVTIEEELENPSEFLESYLSGKRTRRRGMKK